MSGINIIPDLVLVLANYFMGSLPFGLIISRMFRGIDPRGEGSGNIGATNVLRVVGRREAVLTVVCDLFKGLPLIFIAEKMGLNDNAILWIGLTAILGHVFSIFLKFKGGKGVATSFGVVLVVAPKIAMIALVFWLGGVFFSKIVSVGALIAFGVLPFLALLFRPEPHFIVFASTISILVYFRHWENIRRLIRGKEKDLQSFQK